MKYIKLFEARVTYAQKSEELRKRFLTLIEANDIDTVEIEDVLRSIFDITGSPTREDTSINYNLINPLPFVGNYGTIPKEAWLDNAETYKKMKTAYDNLIHGNLNMNVDFTYVIKPVSKEIRNLVDEEVVYVKETLESMGYLFKYINDDSNNSITILITKEGLDGSSIIEEKEYYSSLPKSIIKPFDMFMMQYKIPDEKAAEFAKVLGSADWSKAE